MKAIQKQLTVMLLLCMGSFTTSQAVTVSFEWLNPEKYRDLGTHFHDTVTAKSFAMEVEPYILRLAKDLLPEHAHFEITFTDVDLAGEYEPWRVNDDMRIVRDVYPPRLEFYYNVFVKTGQMLKSGKESIVDNDFYFNIGPRYVTRDEFFYEKELIGSWMRRHLSDLKEDS